MKKLNLALLRIARDTRGQDLVEYALLAGFIAVAAGAILPDISDNISKIFSRVSSLLLCAASV